MKITRLLILFSLLFYVGCGENNLKQNEANRSSQTTQKDLLKELGIELEHQKVSIDFNKTSNFMKKMEIEMHGKADVIQHKIEKADINFTRDMGINISDEKFEIDLNKTKNMFQQINILMKEVLLEENSSKN